MKKLPIILFNLKQRNKETWQILERHKNQNHFLTHRYKVVIIGSYG